MAISAWSTSRGERVLIASAVFTSLATILTALRVYTRGFIVKQTGLDDWIILVSLAFSWAFFGLTVGEVKYGMGEHTANLPRSVLSMQLKCFWAMVPLYNSSLISTKASILFQYLRVFTMKKMRIACYCLIAFLSTYGAWAILSAWLNCIPVAKFWDDSIPGHCLNKKALWFSNSAIHILTDTMIIIYPMPVLKSLNLPKRQKIALMGIFSLGGFVLITTILRLNSLLTISNSNDPSYDNVGASAWSAIECNVAIICACLPGTRALIAKISPNLFPSARNNYNNNNNYIFYNRTNTTRRQSNMLFAPNPLSNIETTIIGRETPVHKVASVDDHESSPRVNTNGEEGMSPRKGGIKVTTALYRSEDSAGEADDVSRDNSVSCLV